MIRKKFPWFDLNVKNILLFLFLWGTLGFILGTETLLGPVRWVANISRTYSWNPTFEDIVVKLVIVLFVAASFFLSIVLMRIITRTRYQHVRIAIPYITLFFALGCLYLWMNPQLFGQEDVGEELTHSSRFTFGPYPTEERLQTLKQEGYTGIISLLHPAVVPFEPKLLADETRAAQTVGIQVIHLPMLPWVSDNKASLDKVKAIASQETGRYYVHCYLGKDRVNVVRRVIETVQGIGGELEAVREGSFRQLDDAGQFERGPVTVLDDGIYLVPYPTDEEFFAFILAGTVRHVVSLMDPKNPDDLPWIQKEEALLKQYEIGFSVTPVRSVDFNADYVLRLADWIRKVPRPLVVHGFKTPSYRIEALIQAYRSHRPPSPPILHRESLARGPAEVLSSHIVTGPRPAGREFGAVLFRRGIRRFAYVGPSNDPTAVEDNAITKGANLSWLAMDPDQSATLDTLANGGPWYMYGPGVSSIKKEIINRFGPAIPEKEIVLVSESDEGQSKYRSPGKNLQFLLDFLNRSLLDIRTIILLSPVFLLYAGIMAHWAGMLRTKKRLKTAYTRKIFHFTIFTMAAILQIAFGFSVVTLFGAMVSLSVLYACYRGKGFPFYEAMARPKDAPHATLFIIVPLICTAAGGMVSNLFFPQFAAIGYLVAGWGDAVGEPVGTRWGKHKYKVPSMGSVKAVRSLEGSAAVFLVGSIVAFIGCLFLGLAPGHAYIVASLCALASAVVEAFSNHGLDNFTIQVTASAVVTLLMT